MYLKLVVVGNLCRTESTNPENLVKGMLQRGQWVANGEMRGTK